jgi:hypothetical protein
MDTEGPLPCSQEPATEFYPGADESSPHPRIALLRYLF